MSVTPGIGRAAEVAVGVEAHDAHRSVHGGESRHERGGEAVVPADEEGHGPRPGEPFHETGQRPVVRGPADPGVERHGPEVAEVEHAAAA